MWRRWFYHFQSFAGITEKECRALMLLALFVVIGATARYLNKKRFIYGPDYYAPLIEEFNRASARADSFAALTLDAANPSPIVSSNMNPDTGIVSHSTSLMDSDQINLNTASSLDLQSLPGIGPALAQRILFLRQRMGRFEEKHDLMMVPGIGPKTLARIEHQLLIEPDTLTN